MTLQTLLTLPLALDNGLGRTPPLTFSVWNFFGLHANESVVLETAAALEATGLRKLGYDTVTIDAGSLAGRDPVSSKLLVNLDRFPSGLRNLSDTLHAMNFKFGAYNDISGHTCGQGPHCGSLGHYELDAKTFAHDWQIDYLKVDFCGASLPGKPDPLCVPVEAKAQLAAWSALRDALNATGRPIYYSICPHALASGVGTNVPKDHLNYAPPAEWSEADRHGLANSILVEYENTMDGWVVDTSRSFGLIYNIDAMVAATNLSYSAPGSWNDADMLQICSYGKGTTQGDGMTLSEYRVHYTVWAILASPLILGTDVRPLARGEHPDCLQLLLNADIVAVNQDAAGLPPRLVSQAPPYGSAAATTLSITAQVFARPLSGGRLAVLLLNRATAPAKLEATWAELGLPAAATVNVYDVVARRAAGSATGAYSATVAPHDVSFVVLAPQPGGEPLHAGRR